MPPLTDPVVLDVYCLVPYRSKRVLDAAPTQERAQENRQAVWAFKNGRDMRHDESHATFAQLLERMVRRCGASPLAAGARDTAWVPVPRSGGSQPSKQKNSDPFPCRTLAVALASALGGVAHDLLVRSSPLREAEKRKVQPGIDSLALVPPVPQHPTVVLVDDVYTTGATLVSCAAVLRKHGYRGVIAAFCGGNDVARRDERRVNQKRTQWRVTWFPDHERPESELIGCWG